MRAIHQAISEGCCLLNPDARTMAEVIDAGMRFLVESGRLQTNLEDIVAEGAQEHERLFPTAIGHACAVPHFYDDRNDQSQFLFFAWAPRQSGGTGWPLCMASFCTWDSCL
jgi:mannitol/fructose-specific phosphotransferase system IIA component (Ntr-type)